MVQHLDDAENGDVGMLDPECLEDLMVDLMSIPQCLEEAPLGFRATPLALTGALVDDLRHLPLRRDRGLRSCAARCSRFSSADMPADWIAPQLTRGRSPRSSRAAPGPEACDNMPTRPPDGAGDARTARARRKRSHPQLHQGFATGGGARSLRAARPRLPRGRIRPGRR